MNTQEDRDELLELYKKSTSQEENLSLKTLWVAYLLLLVCLCILIPKIYIANEIYYTSREISDINNKRDVLLEENRALKIKLENMKYKNQVIDPL
ncbi:hypothetical protein [Campylobacter pinnipediorum]|uniref:Septum formation initiator n=1 Tax=Campylobacter pinnipediorum subsp. pinnipediorum TaxID=1660067 RepID=A0AAX0L9F0_9BACT|nr:hypothetical protein [Campylobacter pinnipediorum]AQW81311.1 hypothetical protein CPIN17260_1019 [Campylobacter pinnipediorum subsp. pinnipediorum]AQW82941.1 hypothetical protein CPIN17261_0933 [Campylobacter pinnipediorum subsp. pinnipediorum]AQW84566.1 hypothetical protein CPIN17262_0884 [Campylobacter pinnipediorum subsp. pinnipediorum]OPA77281.1 hypothetical protein BFG04_04090 [Campylobacter pinnipediorum subsp. pinnipediorum]OPA78208.1 hypothetical protein BFG05_03095 [Campylobacter p